MGQSGQRAFVMRSDLSKYIIVSSKKIPLRFIIRDILFTVAAWGFWFYICWDVLVMLEVGLLRELDINSDAKMDWKLFFSQLEISYTFSGLVITTLLGWAIANTILVTRMIKRRGKDVSPLSLEEQTSSYNCSAEEVRTWRKRRILTVSIDNVGNVQSVK
jgi:poly-beta-1,6-N-acetyl-D-glucosamine biosynthesis protein PgaD